MSKKIIKNLFKKLFGLQNLSKIALLLNYKNYFKYSEKIDQDSDFKKEKIIFLIPENKIYLYFVYHSFLGLIFRKLGYEIYFLKCYKNLNFCKVLPNDHVDPLSGKFLKSLVCNSCNNISTKLIKFLNFKTISLKNLNTSKIIHEIDALDSLIKIKNYKFEGICLGQLSFYDFHINQKKSNLTNLTSKDIMIIKNYILSSANLILNIKEIIKKNFSSYILLDEYSADFALNIYLKNKLLNVFRSSIIYHKNEDPSYLSLTRTSSIIEENLIKLKYWKNFRFFPLNRYQVKDIAEDINIKVFGQGTHNFSSTKKFKNQDLYKKLGINQKKKIIVLFSSSEDEHCALSINYNYLKLNNRNSIFNNNFDWIDQTIKEISRYNNYHLIIKFHPRIGKTFRDGRRSDIFDIYNQRYLKKKFKNTTLLNPETKISSYDLADICDLALVGWGTIGLELARLGIPVIVAMDSFMSTSPNLDLLKCPKNKNDYFKLLNLNFAEMKIEKIIEVFRWYNLHRLSNSFHEKNIINWKDIKKINSLKFSETITLGFSELIKDKTLKKEIIDINYKKLLKINHRNIENEEKKEIMNYIQDITKKFSEYNNTSKVAKRLNIFNY